jgi:NodT family efflux transporter outer membrane factor (OMF) lipoprotein
MTSKRVPTAWTRCRQAVALAALAALSLTAAACMVGPQYQKPPVATPAAFKESPPGDWKQAQPQDLLPRGKWWELFGDPLLNQLEEQVAVSNQSVAQAEAQYRAARAAAQIARAGLFPTVGVAPSVSRSYSTTGRAVAPTVTTTTGSGTGGTGGTGSTTTSTTPSIVVPGATTSVFEVPLEVNYEADVWGKVRRMIESNVATAQASAAQVEVMRLSMQAELAADYFSLRGSDAQKKLLDSTAVAYQKALDLTTNRYKQGIASGVDVAQAQTQLEQTRAQSIDLDVARTQFEHAIAMLTGKPPAELSIPRSPLDVTPPEIPLAVPSVLLERRPDVAAAERQMAAANAQIGVQMAAYYPTISLTGAGGYESTLLSTLFNWPDRFWALGASLAQTIFDGGARRAGVEQARATYDAAVAGYRQTVLAAFQDVEDNLSALRVLSLETTQQAAAVTAAEKSLALSTNRYEGGITTYLEVITAQATALSNENTAVTIQTRRMTAAVNLVKALGGGWTAGDLPSAGAVLSRSAAAAANTGDPLAPKAAPAAAAANPDNTAPVTPTPRR